MKQETPRKLAMMLGLGGLDGTVAIAALAGLFKAEKAFALAILFMAGPAAILTAALLGGGIKERMIAALLAGLIATVIVVFAAGLGPELLKLVHVGVIKIAGGLAVIAIGLLIMGVKLPGRLPTIMIVLGMVLGVVVKLFQ